MKKYLKRMVAVICAVVLTLTLLPATMPVFAAENNENLVLNGSFEAVTALSEDKVYNESDVAVTIAAGTKLPDYWTVERGTDALNTNNSISIVSHNEFNGTNVLQFKGMGFKISQNVNGLVEGENYSLSFDARSARNINIMVDFMYYDSINDTYTPLKTYADTNAFTLMDGRYSEYDTRINVTPQSRIFAYPGNVTGVMTRHSLNFVVPPYANAAKISFGGGGLGPAQNAGVDNVDLRISDELISNGEFNADYNGNKAYGWAQQLITTANPDGSNNPCVAISSYDVAWMHQYVLLKHGRTYKISFKYRDEGLKEDAVVPGVYFEYFGSTVPSGVGTITSTPTVVGEENGWKLYECDVVVPEIQNYIYDTVGVKVRLRSLVTGDDKTWTGTAYYDDLSLKLLPEKDENLITNGDFSNLTILRADEVYTENGATVTLAKGTKVPKDWSYGRTSVALNANNTISAVASTWYNGTNVVQFIGNGFNVSQNVKGIEEGRNYSLSFDALSAANMDITVDFLHYNASTDEYTPLKTYADNKGLTLMDGKYSEYDTRINVTPQSRILVYPGNVGGVMTRHALNFVVPPYANAAKISFAGFSLGPTQAAGVDNIDLRLCNELISNGGFNVNSSGKKAFGWSQNIITTANPDGSGNPCVAISSYDVPWMHQYVLMKPGKTYKMSFKYRDTGLKEDAVVPGIYFEYYGTTVPAKTGAVTSTPTVVGEENGWKLYEYDIKVPEFADYSYDTVCVKLRLRSLVTGEEKTWTGTAYYDDLSIREISDINYTTVDDGILAKLSYSQLNDGDTAKWIIGKYNSDNRLDSIVDIVDAGASVETSAVKDYTVMLDTLTDGDVYKSFLWKDLSSMAPIIPAE